MLHISFWKYNIDKPARQLLDETDWEIPNDEAQPGRALVQQNELYREVCLFVFTIAVLIVVSLLMAHLGTTWKAFKLFYLWK